MYQLSEIAQAGTRLSTQTRLASAPRGSRGFTLIELMMVVAILGVLGAVAFGAYAKNVRSAHRAEVIGDLSNVSLRERAVYGVRGHFASTAANENDTFPVAPADLKNNSTAIGWDISAAGYTKDAVAVDTEYFRQGGRAHGYDALNFMPENARSLCAYGVISGDGSNGPDGDEPPDSDLSNAVFPANDDADRYYARDWFYAFAKCDLDADGVLWEFTTAHFTSAVTDGGVNYGE